MQTGLGEAIGLSASVPDRVELLTQLGERQQQFLEMGRQKKIALEQAKKDKSYDATKNILLKSINTSKVDDLMQPALQESANEAMSQLTEDYHNGRTPEDVDQAMSKTILGFGTTLKKLQVGGQNYNTIRNMTDDQIALLPVPEQAKVYAVKRATTLDELKSSMDKINSDIPNPFPTSYDPQTGYMDVPKPTTKPGDWDKIFKDISNNQTVKITNELPNYHVAATTYMPIVQNMPETIAQAQEMAKSLNGYVPPSIESTAKQFIQEHPQGMQSWLIGQLTNPATYEDNIQKYYSNEYDASTGKLKPNLDAIQKDYLNFVTNGIKSQQKNPEKYLSGRPASSDVYGGAGYNQREADKIYQETQSSSQNNFSTAQEEANAAKQQLDEAKSKHGLKSKQVAQAQAIYDQKVAAAQKRQKENDDIKSIKASYDSGDISFKEYTRKIQSYNAIPLKGNEKKSELTAGKAYSQDGITLIWDGTKFVKP